MSRFEDLKASFKQRLLTAAHKHLFGHLETTISGYEKELDRKRKLLEVITDPDPERRGAVQQVLETKDELPAEQQVSSLDQAVSPADVQQLPVTNRRVHTRQQDSCLDQEDPEPGAGREDCGGSQSGRNFDPDKPSQPDTMNKLSNFSEAESDSGDKAQTDPDRKSFPCSVCSKTFRYKWYLVIHMRAHTGEKPYSCCVCGKRWTHKSRLNCHLKTHTHCSVCGKEFGQKTNLSSHTLVHSGVEPFSCCVGEKRFRSVGESSELHRSQTKKQISDNRWFSCSYCGKRFGLEKPLQVHMRVHSEEKLVCCSGCGKVFPRRESFHHTTCLRGKKQICCSVCNTHFDSKKSLIQHMRFHAGSSTEQKETETDGGDCGGPEPARNSDPDRLAEPGSDGRTFDFSEPDTDDDFCKERTHVKQEDPKPPPIKEEQEEQWTSQEGEQLQRLEEADVTKFPFSPVPVKSEDDEDKPQSSQLHQSQTEDSRDCVRGVDCGGSEPARNLGTDRHLGPGPEDRTSDSSECDTDDSDFWKETREPQSNC